MNEVKNSVDNLIDSVTTKYKLSPRTFDDWKGKVFERVAARIRKLKSIGKPKLAEPILKDKDVWQYLKELHNNFVIVPIDKAANNIGIICKRFYVSRLLSEVGALGDPNSTYEIKDINPQELIHDYLLLSERYGLKLEEKQKTLPIMYWTPKMHYIRLEPDLLFLQLNAVQNQLVESCPMHLNSSLRKSKTFTKRANFIKTIIGFGLLIIPGLSLRSLKLLIEEKRLKKFQLLTSVPFTLIFPTTIFFVSLMSISIFPLMVALKITLDLQ